MSCARTPGLGPLVARRGQQLVNTWVNIGVENRITAIVPHPEMGQGAQTGLDAADNLIAWEDQFVHFVIRPMHVRFGPWRSVDHSQHGFFTEGFFDEVAHTVHKHPYAFRRELLQA